MPFRERVKKAFGRSHETSPLAKTDTSPNTNVYQPGESMPKPKYRQPVDKEHKEKLESFTFIGDGLRKYSRDSEYSPMGSRNHSRAPSRTNSIGDNTVAGGKRLPFSRLPSNVGQLLENADDQSDIANVGGSRKPSRDFASNHFQVGHHEQVLPSAVERRLHNGPAGHAHDHDPFTDADLNTAFEKSSLQVSAGV